ncbi:MAG: CapA family protein, partial [Lachnospiraceae bacterium]|nr:CapA family protein [Lachnospiraceae bacterium]
YVLSNYNASGINGILSEDMLNELVSADLTIINNEFPFSTRGQQAPDKKFTFRVDPKYSVILNEMGVDVASLANNHVLDYGRDALSDTFDTLDAAGIDYIGAGDSLERASALITKEVNGKTFGFLAASRVIPVTSWDIKNNSPGVFTTYDPALLIEAIKDAQDKCDFLTVFVHWGIERDAYPQDYQVNMAKMYADAGADLVIGAHPHVLQGITYEGDTPVFYSLGNFIFNQSIPMTAAVKVTVPYEGKPTVTLVPASAANARTYVTEGNAAEEIFSYLESISKNIEITEDGKLINLN